MPDFIQHIQDLPLLFPLFIFCSRIVDVSFGTFRTICMVRGLRLLSAVVGFFEVSIWLVAISSVVTHLSNPINIVAYAGGFATGCWVGVWIEAKLALGHQMVRLISRNVDRGMACRLRDAGYLVTEVDGHGREAPVAVCFVTAFRRDVRELLTLAKQIDPDAFSTVEDVREVYARSYPLSRNGWLGTLKK
jgi:uncharacterized protein YebE (UPF0316 family)